MSLGDHRLKCDYEPNLATSVMKQINMALKPALGAVLLSQKKDTGRNAGIRKSRAGVTGAQGKTIKA